MLAWLNAVRLPARLNAEQTAVLLGFQAHDIPLLVKAGLLKPLGGGPRNCVKFFAAVEIEKVAQNIAWLDRATKCISRRKGLHNSTGATRTGSRIVADSVGEKEAA